MEQVFAALPNVPDHPALERELLERWDEEGTFQRLREQNTGGPRFRDFVAEYAAVQTAQFKRLGQWMDWGNDYFTFSDTNIEYIWRFLKECHRREWLYKGHRATQWCPRCGTSLSKHEQAGDENYAELEHPSLFVRFPLKGREGESLVVWTTTPWTLPANVAAAVNPEAEYVLTSHGEWRA